MTEVWAPFARSLKLVTDTATYPMYRATNGWWLAAPLPADTQYQFVVNDGPPRPDPRSPRQPAGLHGPAMTFDPSYPWSDNNWPGRRGRGAVWYEIHIGTFTPEGTLTSAIARLAYLADLGVEMVELMPISPIPGQRGWGYDCVDLYAVWEVYGGPRALQQFVDAAHSQGLGVALDVVFNHLGPTGNYLLEFGPYLHHEPTPWGQGFDFSNQVVRQYVIDCALRWFKDFHIDALRLDATHAIVDSSSEHILTSLARATQALSVQLGKPLTLVAESDENDISLTLGRGLAAQWADDIHHALHACLSGERHGYYQDFGSVATLAHCLTRVFLHDGCYCSFRKQHWGAPVPQDTARDAFVVMASNHDQVGNRAQGDRPAASLQPAQLAVAAALVLLTGFTPLIFQGEEWGTTTPFPFFSDHRDQEIAQATTQGRRAEFANHGWDNEVPDPQALLTFTAAKLDWNEPHQQGHSEILAWYRTLCRLRRRYPQLGTSRLRDLRITHSDSWLLAHLSSYTIAIAFAPTTIPAPKAVAPLASFGPVTITCEGCVCAAAGVAIWRQD